MGLGGLEVLPDLLPSKSKWVPSASWSSSRGRLPASEQRNVLPRQMVLWTDLVITCGLKKAPFSSHMQVFFQAFIQTHTGRGLFPKQGLLTRVAVLFVRSLGAAVFPLRDTVCTTPGKERWETERSRRGARERKGKKHSRAVKQLSTGICCSLTGRFE